MAKFGSLGSFRSALHDLVEHTKSNPRKRRKTQKTTSLRRKRAPRRARRNTEKVFRKIDGVDYECTPLGSGLPSMAALGFGEEEEPAPRKKAVRKTRVVEESPFEGFRAKPKKTKRRGGGRSYTIKDPEAPVSFRMAKVIGRSVGGLDTLCPGFAKGTSYEKVLAGMGLTKGVASKVRAEMDKAGVLNLYAGFETTEEQKAIARQILFEVGGISCPTKQNPYYGY